MKKRCAKEAAKMINDGMIVGLGGGSTVGFLIEEIKNSGKQVQAVTPSMNTEELCRKNGITLLSLSQTENLI